MIFGRTVNLRAFEREDLVLQHKWYKRREIRGGMLESSMAKLQQEFERRAMDITQQYFIIETRDGEPVGVIFYSNYMPFYRRATIGTYIGDAENWGRGYGSEATYLILLYCFDMLNLHRVELQTAEDNTRAINACRKFGFKEEGVLRDYVYMDGKYVNMIQMSLLRDEFETSRKEYEKRYALV